MHTYICIKAYINTRVHVCVRGVCAISRVHVCVCVRVCEYVCVCLCV